MRTDGNAITTGNRSVPLMRIQDVAKYLSATTWQVEPYSAKKSFLLSYSENGVW